MKRAGQENASTVPRTDRRLGGSAEKQAKGGMSIMTEVAASNQTPQTSKRPLGRRLLRLGLWILFIDLMAVMVFEGVNLRRFAWDFTAPVRFLYDVRRNHMFGEQARQEGFLNVYENQVVSNPDEANKINYSPLRLAVFEAWAAWTHHTNPAVTEWQPSHQFNAFVMYFNTTLELASAIAAFLIVHHWIRRTWQPRSPLPDVSQQPRPGPWVGIFRATLAFILVWFSPAMIVSAHGWPSWDSWVVPFFLWAVLLCCWDYWFVAGVVFGIGAMFKGQQLFIAAMFILWPLFALQLRNALKWASGFAFAFAMIASGWMLTTRPDMNSPLRAINWPAVLWVSGSALALALVGLRWQLKRVPRLVFLAVAIVAIGCMSWPAFRVGSSSGVKGILVVAAALAALLVWRLPSWRGRLYVIAAVVAGTLLLCIPFFGAGTAWWELGFMYGTERHANMIVGPGNNLCALLDARFGWHDVHEIVYTIAPRTLLSWPSQAIELELRHVMLLLFVVLFIPACLAIALQWRRNDRNFLIALATPWMLFYTIPAQIHERYLLFAAGAGACAVGASLGMGLLDLFLIVLTAAQTANCMMMASRIGPQHNMDLDHPLFNYDTGLFLQRIRPDISWAVLLACAIFFYLSFTRYRRRAPRPAKVEQAVARH